MFSGYDSKFDKEGMNVSDLDNFEAVWGVRVLGCVDSTNI